MSRIARLVNHCYDNASSQCKSNHCAALISGGRSFVKRCNTYGSNKLERNMINSSDCTTHAEMNVIMDAMKMGLLPYVKPNYDEEPVPQSKGTWAEGVSAC